MANDKVKNEFLSFDEFDDKYFPRPNENDFDRVVDRALSRRSFLGGSLMMSTAAFLMGTSSILPSTAQALDRFGFEGIAANTLDTVTLPEGFRWQVVARWGDPLFSDEPEFDVKTRGTSATQANAMGDNNDGMALFERHGKNIFVCNNEYTNLDIIFGNRPSAKPETDDDILKGMNAHGITIMELEKDQEQWKIVPDSPFNRRLTPRSEMEITGPARGHDLLKTSTDPQAVLAKGTWNNCGNGVTPWGTYLACEENFNFYFTHPDSDFEPEGPWKRYGIGKTDRGLGWSQIDPRFDITREPNEPNRAGYVIEIDPLDPTSRPKKRTALGRFKHENAEVVIAADGRIVVYLGDDERGEYLYKFISDGKYGVGGDNSDLLDTGILYAARFDEDGSGEWLALTPETTGMESAAEIAIFTRMAASAVKATTMDRPEWVATNPNKVEGYCALTNNKNRGKKSNAGGDETPVNGPNPREANKFGQIVRWVPDGGDHASQFFTWDLYVLAGNPVVHAGTDEAGSANIHAGNMFNSPDGLSFDKAGMIWIQTDGSYSNTDDFEGMGNNQMLVGDPQTGEIRRFMVGPVGCEVTGAEWTQDRKTMFVGIQHPGEKNTGSHFPDGGQTVPRSCILAITREDGGLIG